MKPPQPPTMRSPAAPPPSIYAVDPTGRIRRLAHGGGVTSQVLDARGRINDLFADRGWHLLEQVYRDEGTPEHFELFVEAQRQRQRGVEATIPDELLPKLVLDRRAARPKWTPPAVAPKRAKRGARA